MKIRLISGFLLTVVLVLVMGTAAGAMPLARPSQQGGAPTLVSYQGWVAVDGAAYTGTGFFKFIIVNQSGTISYWSNDGTSSAGNEPATAVQLSVSNGLFNVLLGDTSTTNMTILTSFVFDGTDRYLRVWFSSNGTAFTQLSPDRRIAAVPYALQAEEARNAGNLDGQDGSHFQARVTGACGVGSSIRAINADGTVECESYNTRLGFSRVTIDSDGDVGSYTAMTLGDDGLGLISYYDATNQDLKVAHCSNVLCTAATITTVDNVGNTGRYSSIAIGSDGLGLISYYAYFGTYNTALKVAHCNDLACTSSTVATVDSGGDFGAFSSIAIGSDGLGLISYFNWSSQDLKVAHCNNINCTSATLSTLDSIQSVGTHTSITIGGDGLGLISYRLLETTGPTYDDLRVAHCSNINCTSATFTAFDTAVRAGYDTSITVGTDGLGLISYFEYAGQDLKVAHCNNATCGSASLSTLDSGGNVGSHTAIAIASDGLGLISYYDATNGDLKVAHCINASCTSATFVSVDTDGNVGSYSAITIGMDGLPLVSYYDATGGDLRVAHCSNSFCIPYFRRR